MIVQSNYRVFSTPEMLIRTKRITEILDFGGFVRGAAYKADALLARIPSKEVDELTELIDVFHNTNLKQHDRRAWRRKVLEEMADTTAISILGIKHVKHIMASARVPGPEMLRNEWQKLVLHTQPFQHDFELDDSQRLTIANMLVRTMLHIEYALHHPETGITQTELEDALETKRQTAGDFEGLAISKVILLQDCPLIAIFEKHPRWKTDVLAPDDIQNSLNHDMIHAVTFKR